LQNEEPAPCSAAITARRAMKRNPGSSERSFPFLRMNEAEDKPRQRGWTEIRGPYYSVVGRRLDSLHAQPFTRNHSKEFRKQMNAIREWLAPGRAATPSAASEISGFASNRQSRPQKTNASMENA